MSVPVPIPSALILAGSRQGAQDPVALAEGVAHKALVTVEGEPLLTRVYQALRDAGVERIAVMHPKSSSWRKPWGQRSSLRTAVPAVVSLAVLPSLVPPCW